MNTITVIGAGTMGNGIAHVFAQNGFKVYLVDMNALDYHYKEFRSYGFESEHNGR